MQTRNRNLLTCGYHTTLDFLSLLYIHSDRPFCQANNNKTRHGKAQQPFPIQTMALLLRRYKNKSSNKKK